MLADRYTKLWQELLADGKAFESHCLMHLMIPKQVADIQDWNHGRILDLGAGDLSYRPFFKSPTSHYIAVDIERTHPELDCVGDGACLPFSDESFDVVFCASVLEHTPHPWKVTAEIHRILKPKGVLLMYIPFIYYLHGEPHDYFRFSPHSLKVLLPHFEIHEQNKIGGIIIFLGMLIQNALLALLYRGILRFPIWQINRLLSTIFVWLDSRLGMSHKFPVILAVVAQKHV